MPEPQQAPPVDYAALAEQARRAQGEPPLAVSHTPDYAALAEQARQATGEPPLTALRKATTISGPPPLIERAESTYPWIGGGVGAVLGGAPGAALGGATGTAVAKLSRTIRTGAPPPATSLAASFIGKPPPAASPTEAGLRESARSAADIGQEAATQFGLQKGAEAVGRVTTGLFKPTTPADTELMRVNEKLGLGVTAPEIAGQTRAGSIGRRIQNATEYSLAGRAEATVAREVGRQNALKGVVTGKEAFRRTGEALGRVVDQGPAYDMLPHHIEAARIFGEEIAPKILDLNVALPQPVIAQLQAAMRGGLSPQLALRAVKATKAAVQKGSKEAVPIGSLDALEKILSTKPTVNFNSSTALRTGLIKVGERGDALLGERGTALARKFTGDLTEGMSQAYPPWDPLRKLYAKGAEGMEEPALTKLVGEAPPEALAAAKVHAQRLPVGQEADAIENLRYIHEAIKRSTRAEGSVATGWGRLYNLFEAASIGAAAYKGGPLAAAGTVATEELLPGVLSWAAHNPTMTKYLTQGIMSRNPTQAVALIARVLGAYEVSKAPIKPIPSHAVGQPPPR